MTTTKTVTREYDAEGRLVKEVETTVTTPDAPTYVPIPAPAYPYQWWQVPGRPYVISSASSLSTDQKYVTYNGTYSTGVN